MHKSEIGGQLEIANLVVRGTTTFPLNLNTMSDTLQEIGLRKE